MGLFKKLKSYLPSFLKSSKKEECSTDCGCEEKGVIIQDSCSIPLKIVEITPSSLVIVEEVVVEAPKVEEVVVESPQVDKVVERLAEVSAKEIKDKIKKSPTKSHTPKKEEAPKKESSKKKRKKGK